jgi:hypothetical protein
MKENPQLYGVATEGDTQINSGMLNGQTTVEQVRTEMTGQNGGQSE